MTKSSQLKLELVFDVTKIIHDGDCFDPGVCEAVQYEKIVRVPIPNYITSENIDEDGNLNDDIFYRVYEEFYITHYKDACSCSISAVMAAASIVNVLNVKEIFQLDN